MRSALFVLLAFAAAEVIAFWVSLDLGWLAVLVHPIVFGGAFFWVAKQTTALTVVVAGVIGLIAGAALSIANYLFLGRVVGDTLGLLNAALLQDAGPLYSLFVLGSGVLCLIGGIAGSALRPGSRVI